MRTAVFLACLLARAAQAQLMAPQERDRQELRVLGFQNACSVAVADFVHSPPRPGTDVEPLTARIGTLTLPPGKPSVVETWAYGMSLVEPWQPELARKAQEELLAAGYDKPGISETLNPSAPAEFLDLGDDVALPKARRPPSGHRLSEIRYSPLLSCALLIYRDQESAKPFYFYTIARVKNPDYILRRGRLHSAYARTLLDAGEIQAALAEAEAAARMTPTYPPARYGYAALLCLNGFLRESLEELAAAVKLDRALKAAARKDRDFEALRKDRRFKDMTR